MTGVDATGVDATSVSDAEPRVVRRDDGGAAILTLNRPQKRNALDVETFVALDAHLAALEQASDSVGVVVLRGAGTAFCAGVDLGKPGRPPKPNFQAGVISRLADLPQPVIAAVHGACYAGGLELALAADLILASETARFADLHGKWALLPKWGLTQRLPRRVGAQRAREMVFTGRVYDGAAAARMGLADACVPEDRLEAELSRLVADISAQSWHSLRGYKRLMTDTADLDLRSGLAWEIANGPGPGPDFAERASGRFGNR